MTDAFNRQWNAVSADISHDEVALFITATVNKQNSLYRQRQEMIMHNANE